MKLNRVVLLIGLLAGMPAVARAVDVAALLRPCAGCHGENGVSVAGHVPHLDGQAASYLMDDLAALADGRRRTAVPGHVPAEWRATEFRAVAEYYASRQAVRPPQATEPRKVAEGAAIHRQRCAECHTDDGRGAEYDAPFMAGQNLPYLINEIERFLSGERKFVYKMDESFRGLSREELESIAHFFASQPQR